MQFSGNKDIHVVYFYLLSLGQYQKGMRARLWAIFTSHFSQRSFDHNLVWHMKPSLWGSAWDAPSWLLSLLIGTGVSGAHSKGGFSTPGSPMSLEIGKVKVTEASICSWALELYVLRSAHFPTFSLFPPLSRPLPPCLVPENLEWWRW